MSLEDPILPLERDVIEPLVSTADHPLPRALARRPAADLKRWPGRCHCSEHWCSNASVLKFEVVPVSCSSWKQTHDIVPTSVVSEASL